MPWVFPGGMKQAHRYRRGKRDGGRGLKREERGWRENAVLRTGYFTLVTECMHARSAGREALANGAVQDKKKFKVLVVDARPHLEGRGLLNLLLQHGIPCTYMLLNAVSLKMPVPTLSLLPDS